MSAPERSTAALATYVQAFDEGRVEDWISLLWQVHIELNPTTQQITYRSLDQQQRPLTEAEAEIGYRLRGYGWDRPVPWPDC
jgi:hypothetical protein